MEDARYRAALLAARQLLIDLDRRFDAALPERLSIATYAVLDALYAAECLAGQAAPLPCRICHRQVPPNGQE